MSEFQKYMHVEKLGRDEVDGILVGECHIFPKLDGSNGLVWWDIDIQAGSRNRHLAKGTEDNNGFREYVHENRKKFTAYFKAHPTAILYGEWLIPHTLKTYRKDMWRRFWIFDVFYEGVYLPYETYKEEFDFLGLDYVPRLASITNPTEEKLYEILEQNTFGIKDGEGTGEGIVIKNYTFENHYGRTTWAKIVSNEFKDNHRNEMGDVKIEMEPVEYQIARRFLTEDIINKVYAKIQADNDGIFQSHNIPQLLNTVWHDFVIEELWSAIKKHKNPTINFRTLNHHVIARIKELKPEVF